MKSKISAIVFLVSIFVFSQETFNKSKDEMYIRTYAKIAVEEMHLHKIPASIKLGQGLLETADGQSELAKNANNHFGIKCKETWKGETYRYTDDAYMECFRKYPNAFDSYRDHSQFLLTRKHYAPLFLLDSKDYKGWAHGLKKAGYATNTRYPQILISKIERYNLQNFDNLKPEEVEAFLDSIYPNSASEKPKPEIVTPTPIEPENDSIKIVKRVDIHPAITQNREFFFNQRVRKHKNAELQYVLLQKDETLLEISNFTGISVEDLLKFNDLKNETDVMVSQYIFLQSKKPTGIEKTHRVQAGETMYSISQTEGIQLQELCHKNDYTANQSLKAGEKLYLRGNK